MTAADRARRYRASLSETARKEQQDKAVARRAAADYPSRRSEARGREKFGDEYEVLDGRPFVGIDGEGGEWCGQHAFGCLTVGTRTLINADGSPLNTEQCFRFLTAQPRFARYVGFFLGYDWTMIFRDLTVKDQARILAGAVDSEGRRRPVWVADGLYGVDYIPKKICKIVRTKLHPDGPGSITVYDTSSYFQCAFTQALADWEVGTEEERLLIARTKEERQHFVLPVPPGVVEYNLLECDLLSRLITKMVAATQECGITIKSYHGPATLATALFEREGVAERMGGVIPDAVKDIFACAYFGGRFETSAVGVAEEVYEYDIASAYPAAMVDLPCQTCGQWQHGGSVEATAQLSHVTWKIERDANRPFAPLPWRHFKTGSLFYPTGGSGWYWQEEVLAAQRAFPGQVHVDETWSYVTECQHKPFGWMPEVYRQRKALGKSTAGRVLKLAMNSSYGVLARTIGGGGRYSNPWWAGQITARTRAKLLNLATTAGSSCLMVATDGLYSSVPLAIPTGSELGDWEDGGQVGPLLIVQPGMYFSLDPNGKKWRTRGISLKTLKRTDGINRLVDAWRREGPEAVVEVSAAFLLAGEDEPTSFIGTKLALAWGKPELIGTWAPLTKNLKFRPEPRRVRLGYEAEALRTAPPSLDVALLVDSAPYEKLVGMNNEVAMLAADQLYLPIGGVG